MSNKLTPTAVLALDLQNEIVHPEGKIGRGALAASVAERNLLARARRVMEAARRREKPVVHVRLGFRADHADALSVAPRVARLKEQGAAVLGTWGTDFPAEVAPRPDELVFTKQCVNPFLTTNLAVWLMRHGVQELVLFGVATNLVVESSARHADDQGFAVTVVEDCCASPNPEWHDFAVRNMLPLFGRVVSSEQLIAEWEDAA